MPVGGEPQVSSGGTAAPVDKADETAVAGEQVAGVQPADSAAPGTDTQPTGTEAPAAEPSPPAPRAAPAAAGRHGGSAAAAPGRERVAPGVASQ